VAGNGEVESAVGVDVGGGDAARLGAGGEAGGNEVVAAAHDDGDVVGVAVGGGVVELAVVGEVGGDEGAGVGADGGLGAARGEGAVAVAEVAAHEVLVLEDDDEIAGAVAAKVDGDHGVEAGAGTDLGVDGPVETARADAETDGDFVLSVGGDGEVAVAVVVEIGDDHPGGPLRGGEGGVGAEGADGVGRAIQQGQNPGGGHTNGASGILHETILMLAPGWPSKLKVKRQLHVPDRVRLPDIHSCGRRGPGMSATLS